jgi:hypothetical protein
MGDVRNLLAPRLIINFPEGNSGIIEAAFDNVLPYPPHGILSIWLNEPDNLAVALSKPQGSSDMNAFETWFSFLHRAILADAKRTG